MNNNRLAISTELLKRIKCVCRNEENVCYACNKVGTLFRDLDSEGWIVDPKEIEESN